MKNLGCSICSHHLSVQVHTKHFLMKLISLIAYFLGQCVVSLIGATDFLSLLNAPAGLFGHYADFRSIGKLQGHLQDENNFTNIFRNYKRIYKKIISQDEESKRKFLLKSRMLNVLEHNFLARKGIFTFEKGINQFSDMTPLEAIKVYTGFIPTPSTTDHIIQKQLHDNTTTSTHTPDSINWVVKGAISPVKNQGSCGSCTLFSAAGLLESLWYLKFGGTFFDLSEQELLNCIPKGARFRGCAGNAYEPILKYQKKHGHGLELDLPYNRHAGTCKEIDPVARINLYKRLPYGDEAALKEAVAISPVATVMFAKRDFFHYAKGVFNGKQNCDGNNVNHAVLIVGYGTENGQDFWLVKNSWGTQWGDKGYFKISRNYPNFCGIATYSFSGTV